MFLFLHSDYRRYKLFYDTDFHRHVVTKITLEWPWSDVRFVIIRRWVTGILWNCKCLELSLFHQNSWKRNVFLNINSYLIKLFKFNETFIQITIFQYILGIYSSMFISPCIGHKFTMHRTVSDAWWIHIFPMSKSTATPMFIKV